MRSTIIDLECVPCGEAADFLERKPRPELLPLVAPGNYKKPESIAQYLAENAASHQAKYEQALVEWEAEWQREIAACALDPDLCEIVSIGTMSDSGNCIVHTRQDYDEATLLADFWRVYGDTRFITYAGFGYDLLVLMRRSDYLGVSYVPVIIDRYRSDHIDLQQVLWFRGAHRFTKGKSLKFYSRRFHLNIPDDDEDGSKVADWVAAGEWQKVRLHNLRDLERTKGLAEKLGYWQPQAEKIGVF